MDQVETETPLAAPLLTHPDDIVPANDPRLSLLPDELETVKEIVQKRLPDVVAMICQDMAWRLADLAPIPVEGAARAAWARGLDEKQHSAWINLTAERKLYVDLSAAYEAGKWKTVLFLLTRAPWEEPASGYVPSADYGKLQAVRNAYQDRKDATARELVRLVEMHQKPATRA
ncbi:hypothetical protein OG528_38210 [Streptomyces platensis]|uniref:hypothetical protein n=1 Tax=Streptomyces platensis TaxID=58346 RepID=UPI0030E1B27C